MELESDLNQYNKDLYDRDKERERLNLEKDDFVILMIAEVNKNKNHIQIINAVEIAYRTRAKGQVIMCWRRCFV